MVAAYTAGAKSFTAERPRLWSSVQIVNEGRLFRWNMDLAPDGKRFAVFPRQHGASERESSVHVRVLPKFFDELRRRVPVARLRQ